MSSNRRGYGRKHGPLPEDCARPGENQVSYRMKCKILCKFDAEMISQISQFHFFKIRCWLKYIEYEL